MVLHDPEYCQLKPFCIAVLSVSSKVFQWRKFENI
uniref:Uncharacterized protein n=1 Tax=Anguilla anguilla TaxID=7936 RepID=A0A0E9STB0_ANGAN